MSVFICDKERLPFSIHSFLDFTAHTRSIFKMFRSMSLRNGSLLKPYNKLAFRVLSGIKHALGYRLVYTSYSFIETLLLVYYTVLNLCKYYIL